MKTLEFVELHEFLLAPLLQAINPLTSTNSCCHTHGCCHPHTSPLDKRSSKMVGDIFTCALCFNRFIATAAPFHPGKVSQFLAYANTILWAYLELEGDGWQMYDKASRLQVSTRPTEDWAILNLPPKCTVFHRPVQATKLVSILLRT
jgi:hypothetical protein